MKMRTITYFGDPYNCLSLLDEDNSVSQTDNFVNLNVFNSVTSPRVPPLTIAFCTIS